jgi:hypothetical protein
MHEGPMPLDTSATTGKQPKMVGEAGKQAVLAEAEHPRSS